MKKERLNQNVLRIDPRVKDGYYSDVYFNRTKEILEKDGHHPILRMQIFQRNDDVCLCGVDEAIGIIREALGEDFKKIKIMALNDGDIVNAWETVMTIEGDYPLFAHLQTVYLGALARGTRIATNVYRCVKAANGKPILFFPARFDSHLVQAKDGYSYKIGCQTAGGENGGVSTDAQGEWWGSKGLGTIPHDLIAAYSSNTVKAAMKFAEYTDPKVKRVVLVDYKNDCVNTTMAVADAMFKKYQETKDEKYILHAVRLDTSGTMVDKSIMKVMEHSEEFCSKDKPTGVNPELVWNVYERLYDKFRNNIGIIVSGGFNPDKIKYFEKNKVPVIAYGVGSSLFAGNFDFTADIVQRFENSEWVHNAKKGRRHNENFKLEEVE